jgi:uncharacterized protein YegL
MSGEPIQELNDGVVVFFDAIKADDAARYAAEIAVVKFGETAQKLLDFGNVQTQTVPVLSAMGGTPMGSAVNLALDLAESRKRQYSSAGVDYWQPWLVLMTDGQPTDDIGSAVARTTELVGNRKLTIFPIGIGDGADMDVLKRFSPRREPMRLKGLNFRAFFEWLSKSVSHVSASRPGQSVPLDTRGMKGWAELEA